MKRLGVCALVLAFSACHTESPQVPLPESSAQVVPSSSASAPAVVAPSASASASAVVPAASSAVAQPAAPVDLALGGRLYDSFFRDGSHMAGFEPDASSTKGKADGKGGPRKDGSLLNKDGTPLLNDAGHDYRLKNFFGWDVRGESGIYGAGYMKKGYVLKVDLLSGRESAKELAQWLKNGTAEVPAYGSVMDDASLAAVSEFIVAVRERKLVHPADVFDLKAGSPGNYSLRSGGNAARGKELYGQRCAGCHGNDGTKLLFDGGEFSLGSHARQKAYEDWLKIMNGQPGTGTGKWTYIGTMGPQLKGTGAEMTRELLDLFAALCDRAAFPKGAAKGKDVDNGDARCRDYLR